MSLTQKEVLTMASLARLELTESEAAGLTSELAKILGYVKKLDELDTSNIPPTTQVTLDRAPLRADERQPGLSKEVALEQAPRANEIGFLVPGFVE